MGNLNDEVKEGMRRKGFSEQEIAFNDSHNQKDWEPILKDPNTPVNVIDLIAQRITLLPLKILAFNHPNISPKSQSYMIEKADNTPYLKDIIEAFLANPQPLIKNNWTRLRKYSNKAQRFDICVMELLEEQSNVFTTQKLDIILNTLGDKIAEINIAKEKDLERWLKAIMNHKNFNISILDGRTFTTSVLSPSDPRVVNVVQGLKNNKEEISYKFYEMTSDIVWLPEEVKDIFVFE